jgi:hypothetical protein
MYANISQNAWRNSKIAEQQQYREVAADFTLPDKDF